MEFQDYLRILKERWRIVAFTMVVVTVGAFVPALFAPPTYQASALLYVSSTQPRLGTYAQLLTGKKLAQRTIDALGLDVTPAELVANVKATPVPELLLHVKVNDTSAERARDIANTLADQFVVMMDELAETEKAASDARVDEPPVLAGAAETPGTDFTITTREADPEPARVTIEQAAVTPMEPEPTARNRNLVLGLVVGLLLGVALAVLRDWFEATVRDRRTVEELIGAPLIGSIPSGSDPSDGAVNFADSASPLAGAYRALRTNLQFAEADRSPRVFVLASPSPDEETSATAANLAIALAGAGHGVCLVEADLRRPLAARYVGAVGPTGPGLGSVLAGDAVLAEAIATTDHADLSFVASGCAPSDLSARPDPSELLASPAARSMIDDLRARFDYVIVAGAPLLPVSDSAALAAMSDGVLLVTRYGKTTRDELAVSVDSLRSAGAPILGAVMTKTPPKADKFERYQDYLRSKPSPAEARE